MMVLNSDYVFITCLILFGIVILYALDVHPSFYTISHM